MASEKETETPVLHVIVVGFHHKKGCQVEYSYPPVIAGNPVDSHQLPEEWKHLPSLALPDGAHNFQKDTVFFHLPSRDPSRKTVYCVSCYRQMDAKDLLNRTADITRSTVQKSVCVISRLPLYGLLKAKLELITHAYFDERDFSKVELLEQTFNNMNASLTESLLSGTQIFLGLSPREAVARFKHKLLVLFKLLLLERRVLFFGSPVETLGATILSVLSLYPGMLEFGLDQAVSDGRQRLVSPTMGVASLDPQDGGTGEEFVEVRYHDSQLEGRYHDSQLEGSDTKPELSELMSHMHNPPVSSSKEAPESQTIPRDITSDTPASASGLDASNIKSRKEAENRQRRISGDQSGSEMGVHRTSQQNDKSKSSDLKVHARFHSQSSQDSTGSGGDAITGVSSNHVGEVKREKKSPLEDLGTLTQISAVQTGRTLPNDQDAMDDYVHQMELASGGLETVGEGLSELTLSVENRGPLFGRSDSIEEMDSPESISKIDREDCFSWEEDRLQLSLAVDADDTSEGHGKTQNDASSAEQDSSRSQSHASDNDTHSSDNSRASTPGATTPAHHSPGLQKTVKKQGSPGRKTTALKNKLSTAFGKVRSKPKNAESVEMKPVHKGDVSLQQDDYGFPLAIFTKGCVCHPYLSLQFHSILNDVNVRSFVLGATNILFRQQKQVTDVIVEIEDGKLDIKDRELQKQLNLTTADLRFTEGIVRIATEERSNMYLDGTEWEGSDEWIRAQFRHYLQSLLATMQTEDGKLLEDFGLPFISAWRTTHNYRHWLDTLPHPKMADVPAGHPFTGNLSVTDVRMKLNHSMQSTERGRKINAAVVQTGKYVAQTGRAVGGAFSSARSAVSSWFTSITNDWKHEEEEEEHQKEEAKEDGKGETDTAEEAVEVNGVSSDSKSASS
ncbi:late secretory pathway protein AVL9 homolog [Littorina saxatilis]|uniref:UDENN domain-containing protein n=1 Tax=Littorina saxatilis TaxID=31220 RepID=A0AAN9BPR3_9CAEN